MKRMWLILFLLLALPLWAQGKKDKKKDDEAEKNKRDFQKIEARFTPKEIILIRFANYICDDGHYTGEFGNGTCQRVLVDEEGNPKVCGQRLRPARRKFRSFWQGRKLVVRGQVSEKLPENLRVELTLRYFRPSGDVFAWKEVTVRGKAKKGWRFFEVVFTFPKKKTVEVVDQRGRLRSSRVRVEVLDGEYWVEARYIKSKQPRSVQMKISELEATIPDYRCGDCRKTFSEPKFVRCPSCNKKLTKKVTRYPRRVRDENGQWKIEGSLKTVFHCSRCQQDVDIPKYDKCPFCGSERVIPMKKDREVYREARAIVYVPKPNYDPSVPEEVRRFRLADEQVLRRIQEHYSRMLKKILSLNKKLDKNFAAAYRTTFMEGGKLDRQNWEKWVFSSVFTRMKPKSRKAQKLLRELMGIRKFGTDRFDREAWRSYIRDEFAPAIQELILEHMKYKESVLALRYPKSHVYLNRLLFAVLKKGVSHYTSMLYNAFQIEPDPGELDVPTTGVAVDVVSVSSRFLNKLFRKIDEEIHIREYWKRRG